MFVAMFWVEGPSVVQGGMVTARKTAGGKVREGNGKCYETEGVSFWRRSKAATVVTELR